VSPSLRPEEREKLLGPAFVCRQCNEPNIRHYCRSCDLFFYTCACVMWPKDHGGHRVYKWTPAGVIADPNFDFLLKSEP